jgi:hypothetical protein
MKKYAYGFHSCHSIQAEGCIFVGFFAILLRYRQAKRQALLLEQIKTMPATK